VGRSPFLASTCCSGAQRAGDKSAGGWLLGLLLKLKEQEIHNDLISFSIIQHCSQGFRANCPSRNKDGAFTQELYNTLG